MEEAEHCCWVASKECQFLVRVDGKPQCSLHGKWGQLLQDKEWLASPIGRYMAAKHPGYECKDWPQNIPAEQLEGAHLCCYETGDRCKYG